MLNILTGIFTSESEETLLQPEDRSVRKLITAKAMGMMTKPTCSGSHQPGTWRKRMGIEPTIERLHARSPDLKSGSPTSELGASAGNVLDASPLDKLLLHGSSRGAVPGVFSLPV